MHLLVERQLTEDLQALPVQKQAPRKKVKKFLPHWQIFSK